MYRLSLFKTLVYYDGVQLLIARDQLDTSCVCLLVRQADDCDQYLCVPVSTGKLHDFTSGTIDLLSVIESSETGETLLATAERGNVQVMSAVRISDRDIVPEWLPEPGLFVHLEPQVDQVVVQQAHDRQHAIIHCSLNPPEARQEPKIAAERLAQAAKILQRVIAHAYKKALHDVDAKTKEAIGESDNYQLEVFAFSPGSFTLHMQTAAHADMWGYCPVEKALQIIDRITDHVDSPAAAVEVIAGYGGHLATAYRDLLQFIIVNETPLTYEWSTPQRIDTTTGRISDKQAEPLYDALIARTDIGIEMKRLVGIVTKADSHYGSWRLRADDDQKDYSGQSDLRELSLSGIEIDARFEFLCEERLTEERGTGKETTELYLKSFRRV